MSKVIGRFWSEHEFRTPDCALLVSDAAWSKTVELAHAAAELAERASPEVFEIAYDIDPGDMTFIEPLDEDGEDGIKETKNPPDDIFFQKIVFWPSPRAAPADRHVEVAYYFVEKYDGISIEVHDLPDIPL